MLAPGKATDAAAETGLPPIAAFMRGGSLEATRPDAADIAALKAAAAARHAGLSQRRADAAAGRSGRAGRAPCAPRGSNRCRILRCATSPRAEALRALPRPADRRGRRAAAAGDRGRPRRARRTVSRRAGGDRLRADLARRHREIGISGYPDGHPRIADHELDRLLAAKLEAAAADRTEGRHRHAVLPRSRADHRLAEAAARTRHRSSGAHRACRADQPHDPDALCASAAACAPPRRGSRAMPG